MATPRVVGPRGRFASLHTAATIGTGAHRIGKETIYGIAARQLNAGRNGMVKNGGFATEAATQEGPPPDMSPEQLKEKLIKLLKARVDKLADDFDFGADLEGLKTNDDRTWDALDTVEYLLEVEDELKITIPDDTADKIKNLNQITEYINSLKSSSS